MKIIKFGKTEFSTLSGEYVYLMDPVMGEKCLCFSAEELRTVLNMMAERAAERAAQEVEA
jgi:pyridoxal/pyridoxine/pyridoxamine kinase